MFMSPPACRQGRRGHSSQTLLPAPSEPKCSPAVPRSSAEPSRKIAFTFFDFARATFLIQKGKAIFLRGGAALRHGGGAERLDFFSDFR